MHCDYDYIIIGAGFSGLAMARKLKLEGKDNFLILERANDLGGTWRDNSYPGCACDVPAHIYSYSFSQKPDWKYLFARQDELLQYLKDFAKTNDLERHIEYNHLVTKLTFDEEKEAWSVGREDKKCLSARYIVAATGPLATPSYPRIEGLNEFEGGIFHSAQWRDDIDLTGKRVAVIGTGASAIQFIPEIAYKVSELNVFQRTASWVIPRNEKKFSNFEKNLLSRSKLALRILRSWLYWRLEMRVVALTRWHVFLKFFEWWSLWHLKAQVKNKSKRKKLKPNFKFGCKRALISSVYYPAIDLETTNLITDGIKKITSNSIVTEAGEEREVDVIILGTGFEATVPMPDVEVLGEAGQSLHEKWKEDGAEAYSGTFFSGFPNFFMLLGPNTVLGHNSVVYMAEAQIEGLVRIINKASELGGKTIRVKEDVQRSYNKKIQEKLAHSVWQTGGCDSWYHTAEGKNVTLWPDFTFSFKKQLENLSLSDFDIK